MIGFMIIQKGAPEVINLIGLLLGILLCLLALNAFFEWLMTKPWKRNGSPDVTITEESNKVNMNQSSEAVNEDQTERSDTLTQETLSWAAHS